MHGNHCLEVHHRQWPSFLSQLLRFLSLAGSSAFLARLSFVLRACIYFGLVPLLLLSSQSCALFCPNHNQRSSLSAHPFIPPHPKHSPYHPLFLIMGRFIWHDWARFVAISASVCESPVAVINSRCRVLLPPLPFRLDLGCNLGHPLSQVLL
jgi:hypothetical protein